MAAKLIKGTEVAQEIREELKKEVAELKAKHKVEPGLVTILVGEDPASVSYVTAKQRTSKELGFHSIQDNQSPDLSEDALLALIAKYNKDPKIHGILIQLPLPKHIDANKVLLAINPDKDVDAFHPVNVGRILIVAAGVPEYVQGDWVKEGACVIDVGVNRVGISEKTGKAILKGDVHFDSVAAKASYITPVPGGVGPMTITMLMKNTVLAAKAAAGLIKI